MSLMAPATLLLTETPGEAAEFPQHSRFSE